LLRAKSKNALAMTFIIEKEKKNETQRA